MNCRICHKLDCDDDCEELAAIAREWHKEQMKDIDLSEMDDCMSCGCPVDRGYMLCYTCEHGEGDDYREYEEIEE